MRYLQDGEVPCAAGQVISVCASEDGERIMIRVRSVWSDGERPTSRTLCLRVEEYAALTFSLCAEQTLRREELAALLAAEKASQAYHRGLHLLGYSANSSAALRRKLTERGYDADVAERAIASLCERGYLREERDACRMALQLMRRGRGERRILQELSAKGYGAKALSAVRETLRAEDFGALCLAVARKKCACVPEDRAQKERLVAYLLRCGFEMRDIRAALSAMIADAQQEE